MRDQTTFSMTLTMTFNVPSSIVAFNSHFPLKTNPYILPIDKTRIKAPTLWIRPPRPTSALSEDVECLKWQAYLALRGLKGIKIRWDIAPEGALSGSLPNLHVPHSDRLNGRVNSVKPEDHEDGDLLTAYSIPAWADRKLGVDSTADPHEGYKDQEARLESRAWVSLLEDIVHAALVSPHSGDTLPFLLTCLSLLPNRQLRIGNQLFSPRHRHSAKVSKRSFPHLQHALRDFARSCPLMEFESTQLL